MTEQEETRSPILIPMIVGSALFMQMLDSTVIATALPKMAESFGEGPVRLNLAITSYMLAVAIFIPVSGWMADRFGPRNVFRTAIALFTASSVLCALSNTLPELVGARMLQGMAGAMMVPVGRIVLLRSVPKSTYVQALSWVTIPALLGPVTGPPVGGFIVTYWSWHWIFLINVPIGILGYVLVTLFIGEIGERETRPLDWQGFLMTGAGLAALIFGFETMGRDIIPLWAVLSLLGTGALLLILYVLHARRAAFPLIDMNLARVPTFAAATFGGALFRLGLGASPFLLALLLQVGFGLSPLEAGLLTFAGAAGALVMKFTAPPIIRRFGMRNVIVVNALIASAFFLAYALFDAQTPHLVILLVLLTGGFFRSLQMTALNALAYADISPLQMSQANTLASMVQQLSLTLGVGLAALVIHWARVWNASPALTPEDIAPAIITVALLGAASLLFFLPLPRNAGEELNGRPARAQDARAEIEQI